MKLGKAICIAGLIGFGAAGMALADDVTFTASGTFDDGASLGGTLVINTGTGVVESNGLDLSVVGGEAGTSGLVFDTLSGSFIFSDGTDNLAEINARDSSTMDPTFSWISISEALRAWSVCRWKPLLRVVASFLPVFRQETTATAIIPAISFLRGN